MAGASSSTRAISVVNANWEADPDGAFAFLVVTDDDQRHVIHPSPAAATALLALCASPAKLLWDPGDRTIIAGGIRGSWFGREPAHSRVSGATRRAACAGGGRCCWC